MSIEEIDKKIASTAINLPSNLKEAIIHECGHAKSYYGKSISEIKEMNKNLLTKGVKGISKIAETDGAECIAEVEVLLSRESKVPPEAMKLYIENVKEANL
jgi:hypothetical protein